MLNLIVVCTLGPVYNEQKDSKETARYKWVLIVTEFFSIAVNYIHAKEAVPVIPRYSL